MTTTPTLIVRLWDTECKESRILTLSQAQALFLREGGRREKARPAFTLHQDRDQTNSVDVFDPDGGHLGCIGWRPAREGLFICG